MIDVVGDAELVWTPPADAVLLAVGGSRRRDGDTDREQVLTACAARVDAASGPVVFVSGGCWKGADRHVELFARAAGLPLLRFLPAFVPDGSPRWAHTRALFARNTRVVTTARELLAQVASDRTGGTEDAVKKAHRLGRPVTLLLPDGTVVREPPPVSKRRLRAVPSVAGG